MGTGGGLGGRRGWGRSHTEDGGGGRQVTGHLMQGRAGEHKGGSAGGVPGLKGQFLCLQSPERPRGLEEARPGLERVGLRRM